MEKMNYVTVNFIFFSLQLNYSPIFIGQRLATISALHSLKCFYLCLWDISKCDDVPQYEHINNFIAKINNTTIKSQCEHVKMTKIAIVADNATQYNALTQNMNTNNLNLCRKINQFLIGELLETPNMNFI